MKKLSMILLSLSLFLSVSVLEAKTYKLATGDKGGTYYKVGKSLEKLGKRKGLSLHVEPSYGSTSNVMILGLGQVDFALAQYEVYQGLKKSEKFQKLCRPIEVVLPLYAEEVHLLVRRDGNIGKIGDLKHKSIGLGQINSGTYYSAQQILEVAGIGKEDIRPNFSSPREALSLLVEGKLDALFYTAGQPVSLFQKMKKDQARSLQLYSFSRRFMKKVVAKYPHFEMTRISRKSYPLGGKGVSTLATYCVLLARSEVPSAVVEKMCDLLFKGKKILAKSHRKWRELSRRRAMVLVRQKATLHQGAVNYLTGHLAGGGALRIAAGRKGGTYNKIGRDIQKAGNKGGVKVVVLPSDGSVHNMMAVATGQADMGITQVDALLAMSLEYPAMVKNFRTFIPLYKEEIHLLVRRDSNITNVTHLAGKRINIGAAGSGTSITAQFILKAFQIDKTKIAISHFPASQALRKLRRNQIDAAFIVGGSPLPLLAKISAKEGKYLKLVSFRKDHLELMEKKNPRLEFNLPYRLSPLSSKSYPWLKRGVKTLATPAVIICSVDVDEKKVEALARAILSHASQFTHPKWKGYTYERLVSILGEKEITLAPHSGMAPVLDRVVHQTKSVLGQLRAALEGYYWDMKRFPTKLNHLITPPKNREHWNGPYFKGKSIPLDAWLRPYKYHVSKSGDTCQVTSFGNDGEAGGFGEDSDLIVVISKGGAGASPKETKSENSKELTPPAPPIKKEK